MRVELRIDSENAAFDDVDGGAQREAARLLREAADRIEQGSEVGHLIDYNGNVAGAWEVLA